MDASGHNAFGKGRGKHFIHQDAEEEGLTKKDVSCGEG